MTHQIKRYGTSSMECENGIYVLHSEYEALEAEVRALREDAERWRTEMKLRNDPTVAIMFAGTNNRCSIYRGGDLIASDHTYAEAIDAARAKETA